MSITVSAPGSTRRERWAWYLYDFGNSAYAAVVLLAIYSAYFKEEVVGGAEGSRFWGIAVGIAMLVVALTSPVLGTIADLSGVKKRFLFFYTAMACLFTATLFFVQEGDVLIGMLFFILAEIGYRSAQVFYNALLPEIASPEEMGRISGNGWAIGSAGGIICLLLVLPPIVLIGGALIVRLALVFTGVFFALSAVPLFLWLRERAEPQKLSADENYVTLALQRLGRTIKAVRKFREFIKFIIAFLVYNDGILMILDFGAILGAVLYGMKQQELIIFMIIVQLASVAGAYLFGLIADDFGGKPSLVVALLLTVVPVFWLYFSYSRLQFYFIGALAGFALTGVQSVSRTMVGMFSPPGQSAEFYGFFAVTGRTSSFIGPTVFGLLAAEATQWYMNTQQMTALAAEQAGHRVALFSIVAFLLAGLLMLLLVNEKKGRAAAVLPEADSLDG
jgi:UMF1 family MFS transporter